MTEIEQKAAFIGPYDADWDHLDELGGQRDSLARTLARFAVDIGTANVPASTVASFAVADERWQVTYARITRKRETSK